MDTPIVPALEQHFSDLVDPTRRADQTAQTGGYFGYRYLRGDCWGG